MRCSGMSRHISFDRTCTRTPPMECPGAAASPPPNPAAPDRGPTQVAPGVNVDREDTLISKLATNVTPEEFEQIVALATLSGTCRSKYLRRIIVDHLQEKRQEFELMQRAFGTQGNVSTGGSE